MKTFLIIPLLIFVACGQQKSTKNATTRYDNTSVRKSANIQADSLNITKKFVTGQFDFHNRDNFVQVSNKYANKEVYLQDKTYKAFKAMADSAEKEGIHFTIISGTRNFNYQKSIWDRKWQRSNASTDLGKAKQILEFSSMPMTSRHHWGTDLDINHLTNDYFEEGRGKKEYEWLKAHANSFGFYQPYTNKKRNRRTGYNEEKWHWSYMPLAGPYLAYYNMHVTNKNISGFKGSDLAGEIDMVKNYVNGVSVKIKQYGK